MFWNKPWIETTKFHTHLKRVAYRHRQKNDPLRMFQVGHLFYRYMHEDSFLSDCIDRYFRHVNDTFFKCYGSFLLKIPYKMVIGKAYNLSSYKTCPPSHFIEINFNNTEIWTEQQWIVLDMTRQNKFGLDRWRK